MANGKGARRYPGPLPVLLIAFTLPALFPLFKPGLWASHDPFHHLFRSFDLDYTLRGWELYPRWLPNLGFFYGYPVTNFYAPLSYYLIVFLHWLGFGFINSLKASFGLSFLLAAFAAYLWAKDLFGEEAGLWVAVAYTYFTYHIANAYVRAALAEHLAFAFFPLILWLFRKVVREETLKPVPFLALGVAGLILTHNLSAFIFAPFALAYALALTFAKLSDRLKALLFAALGAILGLTLSAFYWLPALAENRWIRAGQIAPSVTEPLNFLLPFAELFSRSLIHHYPISQHLFSLWQMALMACGFVLALMQIRTLDTDKKALTLAAAVFVAIAAFMNTPSSSFLWLNLKPLTFLQFPWRFQAMVGLFGSLLVAPIALYLSRKLPEFPKLICLFLVTAIWALTSLAGIEWEPLKWPETGQPVLKEEEVNFHSMAQYDYQTALWARLWGGPWLLEYLPVTVKVPREEFWLPREGPSPWVEKYHGPERVELKLICPLRITLTLNSSRDTYIRWHQFWFPGWQATAEGIPLEVSPSPQLGLVTVKVPAGEHTIKIWFGDTLPRRVGKGLSLVGVLVILILLWQSKCKRAILMLLLPIAIWFALWGWHNLRCSTCVQPIGVEAEFEGKVALLGLSFKQSSGVAEATLYWMALEPLGENLTAFVHLLDSEGKKISQHDGPPGESFSPTTRWEPGEIIPDRHIIPIPSQATLSRIRVGLYTLEPEFRNLIARDKGGAIIGDGIMINVVNGLNH